MKGIELAVDATKLKQAFEPYKAWKMSGRKNVHWTHKEKNLEEWGDDSSWYPPGVCERGMEFVYYVIYDNGNEDRHEQEYMEFTNKHTLYSKVHKQVSEMIDCIEKEEGVVKVVRVDLTLPEGNNDWDWLNIYQS
tara:strand:+ start:57 stop:461 length:405 start_codon:yes stop_codon:yes gene_type:complete